MKRLLEGTFSDEREVDLYRKGNSTVQCEGEDDLYQRHKGAAWLNDHHAGLHSLLARAVSVLLLRIVPCIQSTLGTGNGTDVTKSTLRDPMRIDIGWRVTEFYLVLRECCKT